ncbi:MAG TPA: glycosyltransferase [Anaerolineae bacterium]
MAIKIAYIMSRFPHLPETFILREMTELERQGYQVALYPLMIQRQPVIHEETRLWLARARHLPFLSAPVLAANGHMGRRQPLNYVALWMRTLAENATSPNLFIRAIALMPKAFYAAQLMQREGISHIHAHYATHPALVAWLIHRLTGISYSITVHAHDIFVRTAMLATKLRDASFVAAISEYNREHLARLVGPWIKEKTLVIHCGVVPDQYRSRPTDGRSERFEIIHVGSLQPYKGQSYLIEACARLRDQGIPFRCRIIGGGEEENNLRRLIAANDLESMVKLLGPLPQEEVARLMPTADCYVQPSIVTPSGKMEGIPVALMEAMACRLPVVATDLSGIPELVRPGETGYLLPPADSLALANALTMIYAQPEQAEVMATAGRELVLQDFELQKNVKRLADLFRQVAGTRPLLQVVPKPLVSES